MLQLWLVVKSCEVMCRECEDSDWLVVQCCEVSSFFAAVAGEPDSPSKAFLDRWWLQKGLLWTPVVDALPAETKTLCF